MKKLYATLLLALAAVTVSAQNPVTYFMEGTALRTQWNPAFAPDRGYVSIPLIGNIQVGIDGNLSLGSVVKKNAAGNLVTLFHGSISPDEAVKGLGNMAFTNFDTSLSIVSFGRYTKNQKNFWAADLSLHVAGSARIPRSLVELVKNGPNAAGELNGENLGMRFDSYVEASFSYSLPLPVLDEKLYVGGRFKFLVGMAHMGLNFDSFSAHLNENEWSANMSGSLQAAGFAANLKNGETFDVDDVLDGALKLPSGYGFGVDLGATYQVLPELQVSLSVNDLGAIFYGKGKTTNGSATLSGFGFNGFYLDKEGNLDGEESLDFGSVEFLAEEPHGITKRLHTSINMGGQYDFLERRIGVGLFYSTRFYEHATRHNLVLSANFRPLSWLHVTGCWSLVDNAGLGLGLNICPKYINIFLGTDLLLSKKTPEWIPVNQSKVNFNFGLAVPLGRKGLRHAAQTAAAE